MKKTANVRTNDPENPNHVLTMAGAVESFATVKPSYLRLYGNVGQKVTGRVSIVPSEKYAFKIVEAKPVKGENISVSLEEKPEKGKTGYVLTIDNLLEQEGRYYDSVQIKTDSKIQPMLTVKVYGNIYDRPRESGRVENSNVKSEKQ